MPASLADRTNSLALAAAMSRHPAAGVRGATPAPAEAPSFATVAALLTGPWRVNDPVAFAAAMRAAPLVAGYPVVDLCACARQPTVQLDPLSAALAGHLESAVGAAAERSSLSVRWVAAVGGRYLFVEAAGRAPADGEGPELLVLAHLVEPARPGLPGAGVTPWDDDSWLVVVAGDGRGGVIGIGRAPLPREAGLGRRPHSSRPPARATAGRGAGALRSGGAWGWGPRRGGEAARNNSVAGVSPLGLAALRERLVSPARVAEGLETPGDGEPAEAVVLPFQR